MDTDAARRARRQAIKQDLAEAYTDEEACPPEWVDLLARATAEKQAIGDAIAAVTSAFVNEPDIRRALEARERFTERTRERIATLNAQIRRLNVLAPHGRFTRAGLDPDEALRPLYRAKRSSVSRSGRSGG